MEGNILLPTRCPMIVILPSIELVACAVGPTVVATA